jgi:hypothetical protein
MTNTAHTPAPWGFEEETGRIYFADGDIEPTVAVVDLENTSPQQSGADGRLIAAAPKLLAALIDLLGDRPSVQHGQCIRCGREYGDDEPDFAIETGDCPSDDCPSSIARAAIADATAA